MNSDNSDRSSPLMDSELEHDDDDDEEEGNNGPMRGKVTEKNPNYDNRKEKCNCRKGCSKRTCACFKFGSGCNAKCGCGPSCQNIFNHLSYFFGEKKEEEKKRLSAGPCFSKWLVQKAKDADHLKMIDREELKKMILECRR